MKKNTKMFQRSLTAFLTAALVTTSFGGQGIVFAKAKKKASPSVSLTVTNPAISMLSLKKGETFQLKVKVTPKKKAKKITVRSTKSSIVSVNKKGKCKAKKAGKAKVIVSCGKKKTVISVTVTKKLKKVKKVTLSKKSASLFCGSSLKLTAKLTPAKATKKGVVYRSSKSSVASVSKKGVVMAKKKGTTVITAYAKDGRGAKAVCKITVKEKSAVTKGPAVNTSKPQPTKDPLITEQKAGYFTIAAKDSAASLYLDAKGEDYDGLSLIAASVAKDISLVTKEKAKANVITKTESLKDFGCLFFRFISGNNSIYFSNSQIIRSILFLIRSVMFCMEISCLFDDHSVQCKKCDQVRECHQCIEDICDIPYCFYCHIRSNEYCKDIQDTISHYNSFISVKQVFHASLAVIVPSENCCECKEYKTQHQGECRYERWEWKSFLESIHCDCHTFKFRVQPGTGDHDRKSCHCTDYDCINKCSCHRYKTLTDRFFCSCCCCCDRCTTKSGLV